ncbi:MAG: hypothetical protein N3B13_06590, partial [Deltaproteobacteria bacterium]|nr:hypothetical protein [Deltaproteobacteria bacterium]
DILLELKVINEDQLKVALDFAKKWNYKLGAALVANNFIKEEKLLEILSRHLGIPIVDLTNYRENKMVLKLVTPEIAQKYVLFPVSFVQEGPRSLLMVAMADPLNFDAISEVEFISNYKIKPALAPQGMIEKMIRRYYLGIDTDPIEITPDSRISPYSHLNMPLQEQEISFEGEESNPVIKQEEKKPESTDSRIVEFSKSDKMAQDLQFVAVVRLLIKKGIITKEELINEINKLKQRKK